MNNTIISSFCEEEERGALKDCVGNYKGAPLFRERGRIE